MYIGVTGDRMFSMKYLLLIILLGCGVIGKKPAGEHLKKLTKSPQWDSGRKKFINRNQKDYDQMIKNFDYWRMFKEQFFDDKVRSPINPLPLEKTDINKFLESDFSYVWLGHSTILLRIDQKTILFDPIFTNAGPVFFVGKRYAPPAILLKELPQIDYIVISHDHYDHLDFETIKHFIPLKKTKFLTPLGVSSYLLGWGIEPERITELDWWDEVKFGETKFVCTPSQHFSGRAGMQTNPTLWASWTIIGKKKRVFFSGDTGYDIHFKQIGKKFGPFDLIFMENGQYNEQWFMSHLRPFETIKAYQDMGETGLLQPIHWGMFDLAPHDWFEPIEKTWKESKKKNINLSTPIPGQIVIPLKSTLKKNTTWWREDIENI